ncbi:hypothetical protein L7F22_061035 [Adiantum nelumboides]|nr:hypothetical protein [Adiantum nelumboides]
MNANSSCGSSKGLKNSSWDEIFKRRIKAQEAGNVKEHNNDDAHSSLPPYYDDVRRASPQHHRRFQKGGESFQKSLWSPNDDYYSSPHLSDAYEEKRGESAHRKLVDAGLDRVMEVQRALLQIAKQQVERSNEHVMNEFRYPSQAMPYGNGHHPAYYSPARRVERPEPFIYEMEDSHIDAYKQRAPSSMQYGWMRGEPIAGKANWRGSYNVYLVYPPHTSPYK